jgi:hypothetical protein
VIPKESPMEKKEKYKIFSFVNNGVLEIFFTGEVTVDNAEEIMNEIVALQKSMNTKNELIDVRNLNGSLGYAKTHLFVSCMLSGKPKIKTAFVDIAENADYNSFHEITATNAGLPFKSFTNVDAARGWLKSRENKFYSGVSLTSVGLWSCIIPTKKVKKTWPFFPVLGLPGNEESSILRNFKGGKFQ